MQPYSTFPVTDIAFSDFANRDQDPELVVRIRLPPAQSLRTIECRDETLVQHRSRLIFSKPVNAVSLPLFEQRGRWIRTLVPREGFTAGMSSGSRVR